MNDVNTIVICRDAYTTQSDFQNAIRDAIMVLLNNDYIMTVSYDEKGLGIVEIDYESCNQELGAAYPYWLTPEEAENVACYREEMKGDKYGA